MNCPSTIHKFRHFLLFQVLETFNTDEEDPNDQDEFEPHFESRLNAAICNINLKDFSAALEHVSCLSSKYCGDLNSEHSNSELI